MMKQTVINTKEDWIKEIFIRVSNKRERNST